MLNTIRHNASIDGRDVTLEVKQLPAVPALRLANRLGAIVSGGVASLTSGSKLAWLTDVDFEYVQRSLMSRVTVREADGSSRTVDFEVFMGLVDAETVLEFLWAALKGNYPKSFSKALGALSDPQGLVTMLIGKFASAARVPTAPETKPEPTQPQAEPATILSPSAY